MSEIKPVYTPQAPEAVGPYSQAMVFEHLVFTSGQIALNPANQQMVEGGIREQSEQVMKNLQNVLEASGSSMNDVIKTTCFLADMNDFAAFNAVYENFFIGKPARSCVAVKSLPKGALVEVECIARRK